MIGYFKPLRRKIGVVTLVLACLFAAGWVRSLRNCDLLMSRHRGDVVQILVSDMGVVSWSRFEQPEYLELMFEKTEPGEFGSFTKVKAVFKAEIVKSLATRFFSFPSSNQSNSGRGVYHSPTNAASLWSIPYWLIVIPLTLLSAWLLLSRPRAPKPPVAENP